MKIIQWACSPSAEKVLPVLVHIYARIIETVIFVCAHQKQNQCRDEKHDQNHDQVHFFPEINDIGKNEPKSGDKGDPEVFEFLGKEYTLHVFGIELERGAEDIHRTCKAYQGKH
jgi:hypothetical protein